VVVALGIKHAMRVLRIVVCGLWLYSIFPRYLINDTTLKTILLYTKGLFRFSLQLLSEKKSHSKKMR
jgi:hypothetical protein